MAYARMNKAVTGKKTTYTCTECQELVGEVSPTGVRISMCDHLKDFHRQEISEKAEQMRDRMVG